MLREPFYGMFLIMLNKQWSDSVHTACVGLNGINYHLLINEQFWSTLTEKSHRGLLKHELLHIGFFHLTDFNHLADQEIANYAMDCEINQYIDTDDLPPNPILPSSFPELQLEEKKGTMYYYEKLIQAKKNGSSPTLEAMMAANAAGQCQVTIGTGKGQKTIDLPDHSGWEAMEGLPEATQKLIRTHTENILKEVADQVEKSRGTIPGEFTEILKRLAEVEPPKFDWRGYLRRFAGGSTKIYTKKTRRKYNKRYEENPGLKIKPRRHILFAIDTSASVSSSELRECMNELYHIHKTGTEITVLQCDTAISDISPFNIKKDIQIKGRGGTDFQPVIDYYNENVHKYTCLMYFTDGECSAPTPARGRMLWVLSSQSKINEALIGPQIKLN